MIYKKYKLVKKKNTRLKTDIEFLYPMYELDNGSYYCTCVKKAFRDGYSLSHDADVILETDNFQKARYYQLKNEYDSAISEIDKKSLKRSMLRIKRLYPEQLI